MMLEIEEANEGVSNQIYADVDNYTDDENEKEGSVCVSVFLLIYEVSYVAKTSTTVFHLLTLFNTYKQGYQRI